ncbi:MAG: dTMP kinase [Zetaproteobacteria bacterium]|nr:MAG: dTMP kinase [Zetaproteobacteria bacterium]
MDDVVTKPKYDRGFFISLEGGEGSGKTTQINRLVDMLSERGYDVVITREPGGTPEAENIRNLLVQRDGGNWNAMAEVLLLFAARSMHIETLIKPALNEGKIVICDRFTDSTFAYQGSGRKMDIAKIQEIERISIDGFTPDLTFILDIDVRTGLNRSNARLSEEESAGTTEDRFERLDIEFHERLREGFLDIARRNEGRCYILNAAQTMDHLSDEIKNITLAKLQG